MPRIVFFQVKDSASKLSKIAETALAHFQKKEPLLILVPDRQALEFVDNLLWRYPEESFLPHAIAEVPCQDLIAVSTHPENLNQARTLFNLCSSPLLWPQPPALIYELEDLSTPDRKEAAHRRFQAYHAAGFPISSA